MTQALDAQHSAPRQLDLAAASALPSDAVLLDLDSSSNGLSSTEARARLERVGPNALRSHGAGADVTELVPGDVVRVGVGDVVPADLRLLEAEGLECDESVLTGKSAPAEKNVEPVTNPESRLELPSCAFMGTVVRAGSGAGVVVQTGGRAEFGKIAMQLGEGQPQTAFQLGLRDFSLLLVRFAGALSVTILIVNVALGRPVIQSLLFALSISIGLTPLSCCRRSSASASRLVHGGWRSER